ncbi:MAG: ROK family transcriptional regulator [Aeromicrobium sp.]
MSAPGSTASLRTANQRRVVEALRADRESELSQAEIARATELAPATVSGIVKTLSAAGFLESERGAGRRGAMVKIARSAGLVAGVDFGHSHLQIALGDLAGNVLGAISRPLKNDHDHAEGLALAAELLDNLLAGQGAEHPDLRAVGMGLPAPISDGGTIDSGSILPGWVGVDAAKVARARFGVPTLVDNDANLGALAEHALGVGVGSTSMAYLKVSSGVGCGLILGGKVFRGGLGTAGEIGHLTMDDLGPLCRCGSRGCLEAYVGADALIAQFAARQPDITMTELIGLALDGDTGARRLIEDSAQYLGRAAAILANVLGLELIVIGGDLSAAGDLLFDGIRNGIRRHALEPVARIVRVEQAALGDKSSAIGSLLFALEAVELPS